MYIYRFSAPELIELLGSYGVTQSGIARETGISITTINRVANGVQKPKEKTVDALIELLRKKSEKMTGLRDDLIAMIDQGEL